MDPKYLNEVQADHNMGMKLGLQETPTIVVVTAKEWIQVKDPMQLYQAIDKAESDIGMKKAANGPVPAVGRQAEEAAPAETQTTSTAPAAAPAVVAQTPVMPQPAEQAKESSHTVMYAALGVGAVGLVGGSAMLVKKRKSLV
jgi:hypothetical protein